MIDESGMEVDEDGTVRWLRAYKGLSVIRVAKCVCRYFDTRIRDIKREDI